MPRYHLTENGPKPCNATVRDCPFGGAHFRDKGEATIAYEFTAAKKHVVFGGLKKQVDPHLKHVSAAEKRIRSLEAEMRLRDERQEGGTLYHQFLAEGISEEELTARFQEETNTREAGLGYAANSEGGAKAIGLTYGGDYKSEEESGIAHIAKALRAGDLSTNDVQVYEKDGFTVFAVKGERNYDWDSEDTNRSSKLRAEAEALRRYESWSSNENYKLRWALRDKSAIELKAALKDRVSPMPKGKDAMIAKLIELDGVPEPRHPAIGEFQTGSALVIVTKDPAEAKLIHKLKETHDAGYLRVGGTANPFGRGSLFYDDRDLTREYKSALIRDEEAKKYAKAYISGTKSELEKSGSVWSVSPQVKEPTGDIRNARFWLNYSPRVGKQISGWFNKEQLDRIATGDLSDVTERN